MSLSSPPVSLERRNSQPRAESARPSVPLTVDVTFFGYTEKVVQWLRTSEQCLPAKVGIVALALIGGIAAGVFAGFSFKVCTVVLIPITACAVFVLHQLAAENNEQQAPTSPRTPPRSDDDSALSPSTPKAPPRSSKTQQPPKTSGEMTVSTQSFAQPGTERACQTDQLLKNLWSIVGGENVLKEFKCIEESIPEETLFTKKPSELPFSILVKMSFLHLYLILKVIDHSEEEPPFLIFLKYTPDPTLQLYSQNLRWCEERVSRNCGDEDIGMISEIVRGTHALYKMAPCSETDRVLRFSQTATGPAYAGPSTATPASTKIQDQGEEIHKNNEAPKSSKRSRSADKRSFSEQTGKTPAKMKQSKSRITSGFLGADSLESLYKLVGNKDDFYNLRVLDMKNGSGQYLPIEDIKPNKLPRSIMIFSLRDKWPGLILKVLLNTTLSESNPEFICLYVASKHTGKLKLYTSWERSPEDRKKVKYNYQKINLVKNILEGKSDIKLFQQPKDEASDSEQA